MSTLILPHSLTQLEPAGLPICCENCRWSEVYEYEREIYGQELFMTQGQLRCLKMSTKDDLPLSAPTVAIALDHEGYAADVFVSPEFHCAMHYPRPDPTAN